MVLHIPRVAIRSIDVDVISLFLKESIVFTVSGIDGLVLKTIVC